MAHVITQPCVGVKQGVCVSVCPEHCIYDAGAHYVINPDDCTDCGLCLPVCPVGAIFAEADVPEPWRDWIDTNAEPFRR